MPLSISWERVSPWLSAGLLAVVVLGSLGLFVWLVFFTNIFVVQAITVLDARPHTTEAVKRIIDEELTKTQIIRWQRNIFFVRPQAIEHKIITAVPQVRSVHLKRELPGTVKAVVQEKTPTLLLLAAAKYYLVDAEGIAYEEARLDTLPGTVLPTVKSRDAGSQVQLGTPVVSDAFVAFVQQVQGALPQELGAQVAEIRIPSLAAREVTFRLDNNWEIRFDVTRDAVSQLVILKRVLETTISAEEKKTLDYIDLRITNRVYYKTRGVTSAPTSTP